MPKSKKNSSKRYRKSAYRFARCGVGKRRNFNTMNCDPFDPAKYKRKFTKNCDPGLRRDRVSSKCLKKNTWTSSSRPRATRRKKSRSKSMRK